jgi:hypothetical protein
VVGLWAALISKDDSHIKLFNALDGCMDDETVVSHIGYRFRSRVNTLPVLHTCQEARAEGLRYYTLAFGYEFELEISSAKITFSAPHRIYINWEIDTICLMPYDEFQDIDDHGFGQLPLEEALSYFQSAVTPKSMKIALGPCQPAEVTDFDANLKKCGLSQLTPPATDITPYILAEFDLNDPPIEEYREYLTELCGVPFAIYFVPTDRVTDKDMCSKLGVPLNWIRETYALFLSYRPEEKDQVMDQVMDALINGTSPSPTP